MKEWLTEGRPKPRRRRSVEVGWGTFNGGAQTSSGDGKSLKEEGQKGVPNRCSAGRVLSAPKYSVLYALSAESRWDRPGTVVRRFDGVRCDETRGLCEI